MQKDRTIPITDLFTLLQEEYICYWIRSKIYTREEDKKKFLDICAKKRDKIEQIATKNCATTIFNSKEKRDKYIKNILGEGNFPNFHYRDAYQRKVKGYWDRFYYYSKGAEVVTMKGVVGVLTYIDAKENSCRIKSKTGGSFVENMGRVKRIFEENFFDF